MPFCPKCRYEYREGIEKCPDCDMKLVAKLHEKPHEDFIDTELVVVARFMAVADAEMARLKLNGQGIESVVMDTVSPGLYVGFTMATQGVRLMTRAEDADRARTTLEGD